MNFNLKALMELVKNGQFIGIDTMVVPTIRKTMDVKTEDGKITRAPNPYYGKVTKVVAGSRAFIGASYEKMVNRHLQKEAEEYGIDKEEIAPFVAEKLPWGEYVEGGFPVITHKGKFYLRVIYESSGTVQYFFDGKPINKDEIVGLTEKTNSSGQGGLIDKVNIRSIGFDSILSIRAAGQELKGPFDWRD